MLSEEEKQYIVDEKYRILLKPILFSLEQLYAASSGENPRSVDCKSRNSHYHYIWGVE